MSYNMLYTMLCNIIPQICDVLCNMLCDKNHPLLPPLPRSASLQCPFISAEQLLGCFALIIMIGEGHATFRARPISCRGGAVGVHGGGALASTAAAASSFLGGNLVYRSWVETWCLARNVLYAGFVVYFVIPQVHICSICKQNSVRAISKRAVFKYAMLKTQTSNCRRFNRSFDSDF
jgi:hypothetical protein